MTDWGPMQIPRTSQILGQIRDYLVQVINGHGLAPVLRGGSAVTEEKKPAPYTGDPVLHSTADEGERLPSAEERWLWTDSPSRPGYFQKRREERRGKGK